MRAMGALRVFRPFRTTTVKLPRGKKWACLPRRTPQIRHVGFLRSLLRALNGTKLRTGALLTRRDVPFNLVAKLQQCILTRGGLDSFARPMICVATAAMRGIFCTMEMLVFHELPCMLIT